MNMKTNGILNKKNKVPPKHFAVSLSDSITLKESLELKSFHETAKKFFTHIISGWFPGKRQDLSPDGVNKIRVIDRLNNFYKEKIIDIKTGRVIRDIEEKLTDHK